MATNFLDGLQFEPIERTPVVPTIERNLTLTGKVYDLATSGYGANLRISACIVPESGTITVLGSATSDSDGSYYIALKSDVLPTLETAITLRIFAFQNNVQLDQEKEESISVQSYNQTILKHISVFTKPSVKGVLKRKNDVPAVGCLVELYFANDLDTLVENAITDINGNYEIPYSVVDSKSRSNLRLKFYNNEDITSTTPIAVTDTSGLIPDIANNIVISESTGTTKYFKGDIIVDEAENNIYVVEAVTMDGSNYTISKKLIYINEDDDTETVKKYCSIFAEGAGYKKVLEKSIELDVSFRKRKVIKKEVYSGSMSSEITYVSYDENFCASNSPVIVTNKRVETVNFKFKKDTLDVYTRLTQREADLLRKTKTSPSSLVPTRSLVSGYSPEDTAYVASIVGGDINEIQILNDARNFNAQLKLNEEAVLFGLLKMGVKPNLMSFFSTDEKSLISKIEKAIQDKIIPDLTPASARLYSIKSKIIGYVAETFGSYFKNITDVDIQGITSTDRLAFVTLLIDYSYDGKKIDEPFWSTLGITDNILKSKLRLAVEYSDLCQSNDLFINLFVNATTHNLKPVNELLKLTKSELISLISDANPSVLSETYLPKELLTADAYGTYIDKQIELFYPTQSLLLRISRMSDFVPADPGSFNQRFNTFKNNLISIAGNENKFYDVGLTAHTPFDIEKEVARDYIAANSSVANPIYTSFFTSVPGFTSDDWVDLLTLVQRIYSLTNNHKYESIAVLINRSIYSAYDIVKLGRNKFYSIIGADLDNPTKKNIYNTAEVKVNKALALLNKYSSASNGASTNVIGSGNINGSSENKLTFVTIPELSTLLGDQDVTDTPHCESVFGPAAYLVDLLNLLRQFEVSATETLYDKLIVRRPDLARIPLDCKNALTTLPVIDLVIEILENAIKPKGNTFKWETTLDAVELKTDPEHIDYGVYDLVRDRVIDNWQTVPFDLKNEELKLYWKALGISRAKLAEIIYPSFPLDPDPTYPYTNPYYDILGFNYKDSTFTQTLIPNNLSFSTLLVADGAFFNLPIKEFLNFTGLNLAEFKSYLESYYINPVTGVVFDNDSGNQTGTPLRYTIHFSGKMELANAYLQFSTQLHGVEFLQRFYQFQRLLKATQWSMAELDAVIFATNFTTNLTTNPYYFSGESLNLVITKNCIETIGKIKLWQNYYGWTNEQVVGLFGKIHVLEYSNQKTLFYKTFKSENYLPEFLKSIAAVFNGDIEGDTLLNTRIYSENGTLLLFMQYLSEVLNLSTDDVKTLQYFLDIDGQNNFIISKNGLVNLVRAWQLNKILKIEYTELVALSKLLTITQIDDVKPLLDLHQFIANHNFDVYNLLYYLNHAYVDGIESKFATYEDLVKFTENITNKKAELGIPSTIENIPAIKEFISSGLIGLGTFTEELVTYFTNEIYLGIDTLTELSMIKYYKALSVANELEISEAQIVSYKTVTSKPIDIFNLPTSDSTTSQIEAFKKLVAIVDAATYLVPGANPFEFYESVSTKTITAFKTENDATSKYLSWHVFVDSWKHNQMLDPNDSTLTHYNPDLQWFNETGNVHAFLQNRGIDALDALGWLKWDDIQSDDISTIKEVAKDKLGASVYLTKVSAGRDELRIKQRDALIQYFFDIVDTANQFNDVNELYSYFLIDTQMTPAVTTSRIVQATLAIQLFIQRIQFNLEVGISLSKDDEKHWKWMSLYRVWEANRKIFLYPENWLEPELRDNKSPYFKELEKELVSNEINAETIESAYLSYLSKVEKVSNLEYCQLYHEVVNAYSVLHVIGRTRFEPREHFYRKFVNESYWTAWEKIEVEINSEHLAPVVIKDRLVLFWLEFTDEAQEPTDDDLQKTLVSSGDSQLPVPKRATKLLKIKLCWSEYRDKKWTLKKTADQPLEVKDASSRDKFDYQLVFKSDNIHVIYKNSKDFTFWVECNNHIEVSNFSTSTSSGIKIPEGLTLYGQKLVTNTEKDVISLPIPTENGTLVTQQIADTPDGTKLIFPHQYSDIKNQSSYIVENKFDSLVLVPIIQPEKTSQSTNIAAQKAAMLEQVGKTSLEQVAQTRPDFFTDDHQDLSIINDTPDSEPVVYSVKDTTSNAQGYTAYKSKINAYLGYHPYMGLLRTNLERYGVEGMLDPLTINADTSSSGFVSLLPRQENQEYLEKFEFNSEVVLNLLKDTTHPEKDLKYIAKAFEFNTRSTYGIYNWELFFHIPYLMATHFTIQGDYDQALKWMHYIFDPRISEGEAPARYWKFKPFADYHKTTSIEDMMYELSLDGSSVDSNEMNDQIEIWSNDPFKPHNIAQMRVSAYMKAVVMKYLDILVARGDESFRTDTMESINEALMYYIIGAQILGKKPEVLETSIKEPKTYTEFQSDGMGNCIESFEEPILKPENAAYLEKFVESNEVEIASKPFTKDKEQKNMVMDIYGAMHQTETVYRLYFGIPKNDKFFGYWDLVADRLFKIRNSMNIDGVKRTLDLFAPPIDPGLLARAAASGVSISDALSVDSGNTTEYRFTTLLQLAVDICNEVKSLGGALLSAWEKHDSEYFSQLKASQEIAISEMISDIKLKNIEEAQYNIEQLEKTKELTIFRRDHYKNLERRSKKEVQQLAFMDASQALQLYSQAVQVIAGTTVLTIPEVKAGASGFGGSPYFVVQFGGREINVATQSYATAINMLASISSHLGTRSGIVAGYERREEEWDFQADMADQELLGLEKQWLAAQIRKAIAEKDNEVHLKQLEQSRESYEVLKTKFTNQDLYLWMANELSSLYRSAYQTAYKMAKKAENAYHFELDPENSETFIDTNHFDANYKGLLAGERLFQQLKKMEASYLENNTRKFELTKHISLAMLDPQKIINLRDGGICNFNILEDLFDFDFPGHYNRRIKSVSLTIPCVTGPYTPLSATLSLVGNSSYRDVNRNTKIMTAKVTQMATSNGVNDHGMFELNFNDARYLPFEGAGIESSWSLRLPNTVRQFDYNTITDVILHIQYTAEGGYSQTIEDNLVSKINTLIGSNTPLQAMFSLKHQFPEAWAAIKNGQTTINIAQSAFPYFICKRSIKITEISKSDVNKSDKDGIVINNTVISELDETLNPSSGKDISLVQTNTDALDDIIVLVNYTVS